jgi:hypothetical protein
MMAIDSQEVLLGFWQLNKPRARHCVGLTKIAVWKNSSGYYWQDGAAYLEGVRNMMYRSNSKAEAIQAARTFGYSIGISSDWQKVNHPE